MFLNLIFISLILKDEPATLTMSGEFRDDNFNTQVEMNFSNSISLYLLSIHIRKKENST